MFGAHPAKSAETTELINKVFTTCARGRDGYTVVYGYSTATGVLSKKSTNYVLGFSVRDRELVVMPMSPTGEPMGELTAFKAGDGTTFRKATDGSVCISSPKLAKPLEILVPPFSPDTNVGLYLRAINQPEAAANFMNFIKSIN